MGNKLADITFSQLWETERSTLADLAAKVPRRGVVVEIGTAQGGSSYIINEATEGREVNIFSFDIAPSPEAFEHLANTRVKIYPLSSLEGAQRWRDLCGEPIDLLLIDGSHAFQHVFEDIQMWMPWLRPGGVAMFHDYDSDERGGLVHLGTEVALKALLQTQRVSQPVHRDRLLYGQIDKPKAINLSFENCLDIFKNIGRDINRLAEKNFTSWNLIGHEAFARMLSASMKIDVSRISSSFNNLSQKDKFLVFARPLAFFLEQISEHRIPSENYIIINSLQACYLLEKGLHQNRDMLLDMAVDRRKFFGVEEKLFMFQHAFGSSKFPEDMNGLKARTVEDLSAIIAGEQIRLGILAELFEGILGWKP
jgi:hypothetical protein